MATLSNSSSMTRNNTEGFGPHPTCDCLANFQLKGKGMKLLFKLEIKKTGSASFATDPELEVARILRDVALKLGGGQEEGRCMDGNGNRCGEWRFDRGEEDIKEGGE